MESFAIFHSQSSSKRSFFDDEGALKTFECIIGEQHLSRPSWTDQTTDEDKLTIFRCLRLFFRDDKMLQKLETTEVVPVLCQEYVEMAQKYLHKIDVEDSQVLKENMTELTSVLQKVSSRPSLHKQLIYYECHNLMMTLLSCSDQIIIQSSLLALTNLCKGEEGRDAVLDLCPLYSVIDIISNYDSQSQTLAADLFVLFSLDPTCQQQIKDFDLLPSCITLIQSNQSERVKQKVFKALQKILINEELLEDFHANGGIPVVVKAVSSADQSQHEYLHSMLQLLCTLCVYDPCAKQIAECNGVYHVASYLEGGTVSNEQRKLNADVLRTLRYLFSLESNRRLMKRLFPTHIFEFFIDVGHYVFSLDAYAHLCKMFEALTTDEVEILQANIGSLDKTKEPIGSIGGYFLLEVLGAGAYGVVYKVTKGKSGSFYAMKEITAKHPALGGKMTMKERAEKAEKIISEVAMTQKNIAHPNIVKFFKCFQESQNIYIVMNLIDGASLSDHITSLKEKSQRFAEKRIWNIFTQLTLGLRYLHEEKHIVHRDLKPANLMLGERDKVTITDFGLAKEQNEFSVLKSVVGTMLYWSPELVQNEPYDKKVDIWAAGCILYEMAVLSPPFTSGNMLTLAKKIAEADYDRCAVQVYSCLVGTVIDKCLCLNPTQRPNALQVGSLIVEHVMNYLDAVTVACNNMERKLSQEREKSLHHKRELLNSESRQHSSRRRLTFSSPDSRRSSMVTSKLSPLSPENGVLNHSTSSNISSKDDIFFNELSATPPHFMLHIDSSSENGSTSTPNKRTSVSSFSVEGRRQSSTSVGWRKESRSSLLSISTNHLREIADPVGSLMTQVHKLVYISQLPPASKPNSCHLIVLQYKKLLFSTNDHQAVINFKSEIQKLSSSSNHPIVLFPPSPRLLPQALAELRGSVVSNFAASSESSASGILTYELLHAFIEDILEGSGYYKNNDGETRIIKESLTSDMN